MINERTGNLHLRFVTTEGLNNAGGVAIGMGVLLPAYDRYIGQASSPHPWELKDYLQPQPGDAILGMATIAAILLYRKAGQIYRSAATEARNMRLRWNGKRLVSVNP